jgi:hypothetical protein
MDLVKLRQIVGGVVPGLMVFRQASGTTRSWKSGARSSPYLTKRHCCWFNREEIDVMAGRCFTELKQPARAEPLLRSATSGYDNALIQENSLHLSWLAEDYILLNEIELDAEIAIRVVELGRRANSARTDERLRHLAMLLGRHKDVQSAVDFLDQCKEMTIRTPRR